MPESDVGMIPDDLAGKDVIELGCGTAYVSAWLARRGAQAGGDRQLRGAARDGASAPEGARARVPAHPRQRRGGPLPDASFDLAISEYGASIWCDPYAWIPEARRLLRPGGRLVFLVNSPIHMLFMPHEGLDPVGETLLRPYFGMHRFEWGDDDSVEFHLTHGKMIDLLRSEGFDVEGLVELRPAEDAGTPKAWRRSRGPASGPTEEVWKARLRPDA